MSQTETGKATAADERTEAARSFVRTVKAVAFASSVSHARPYVCWTLYANGTKLPALPQGTGERNAL